VNSRETGAYRDNVEYFKCTLYVYGCAYVCLCAYIHIITNMHVQVFVHCFLHNNI